jgi:hypothetical protein
VLDTKSLKYLEMAQGHISLSAGLARVRIEPGRAGLGPGTNSGLRAGLASLVLIGHLYA